MINSAKGEECIPVSWDIFHEKSGFMLIFWNYAGVPFVRNILQQSPFAS